MPTLASTHYHMHLTHMHIKTHVNIHTCIYSTGTSMPRESGVKNKKSSLREKVLFLIINHNYVKSGLLKA